MMLPNQINTQRFSAVGKGGYRASEVDAFIQKVFQNYNKLYNDNNILKERLSSITPLIDEYNENKKAIANALIWAQTTSDKTVSDAKSEAKRIVDAANAEGENIIADKKAEAEAVYANELKENEESLEKAKAELTKIKTETEALSEEYIGKINKRADEIIEDANSKASKIVADAYSDAKTAREKADAIVNEAEKQLEKLKEEAAKLRSEIEKIMSVTAEAVSSIELGDIEKEIPAEAKLEADSISKDEFEEFTLDFSADSINEEKEEKFEAVTENSFEIETVIDEVINESPVMAEADLISGPSNTEMPDVNAYISKIFESAGSEESDFSSFADGLDDILAQSLEESNISFEELKKSMDKDVATVEE